MDGEKKTSLAVHGRHFRDLLHSFLRSMSEEDCRQQLLFIDNFERESKAEIAVLGFERKME